MKPENNINLYDFLVVSDNDYDTYDTEYDVCVTVVAIDDKPSDKYEEFYHKICKKVDIVKSNNFGLTINWCDLIKRNLEKFKEFTNKHWKYTYEEYEDDEDEFIYQWIKEINLYFAGYVGDSFYETLCDFADTLI